ncbi:MAG: hypothetical protein PHY73_05005 [Candidatus Omnitrophica bacterium]|nr:hypothetical protein [Candidatus Omnitrophota bacterium]
MKIKFRIFNRKALSLPELLLAVFILAFSISSILLLFIRCGYLNEANRNLSQSAMHAQYIMEEIKNKNFTQMQQDVNNGYWNWDSATIASKGFSPLDNETTITQRTGTNPTTVTTTIYWTDKNGRNRNYTLSSIFTQ